FRNFCRAHPFFLSPRRRSGERTEERGIQAPSSPRPSPPSDGGEGVSLLRRWRSSTSDRRFLFPRHIGKFCGHLDVLRWGLRHLQFRIDRWSLAGRRHVSFPRSDARLQTVVFRGLLVARLHIKQGQIGVDRLFV